MFHNLSTHSRLLPIIDFVVILLAAFASHLTRFGTLDLQQGYLALMLLSSALTVGVLSASRAYLFIDRSALRQLQRLIPALIISALILISLGYLNKTSTHYSRLWAVIWGGYSLLGLILARQGLQAFRKHPWVNNRFARQLVLVGEHDDIQGLASSLKNNPHIWLRVTACFGTDALNSADNDENSIANSPLYLWCQQNAIDDLILVPASHWTQQQTHDLAQQLHAIPANLHIGPTPLLKQYPNAQRINYGPLALLNLTRQPLAGLPLAIKNLQDRLIAALALIVLSPLLLTLALLIKLSGPGPMLFKQNRYGFHREIITVYKFRSMIVEDLPDPDVTPAAFKDTRVTPIGHWLRRFSLDELPQLINVLKGDMSLIGPRPHALPHDDRYSAEINDYLGRHKAKPGITGWAQANGLRGSIHNTEQMRERLEHDLFYVENWSPLLDLEILVRTLYIVLSGKNAY